MDKVTATKNSEIIGNKLIITPLAKQFINLENGSDTGSIESSSSSKVIFEQFLGVDTEHNLLYKKLQGKIIFSTSNERRNNGAIRFNNSNNQEYDNQI